MYARASRIRLRERMLRLGRAVHDADRPPRDAPPRRFRAPEPFFRACDRCALRTLIRQAFARLRPDHVQQDYPQPTLV